MGTSSAELAAGEAGREGERHAGRTEEGGPGAEPPGGLSALSAADGRTDQRGASEGQGPGLPGPGSPSGDRPRASFAFSGSLRPWKELGAL